MAVAKVNEQIFSLCYLKHLNQLLIGTMSGALHVIELNEKKEIHHINLHKQSIFDIQYFDEEIYVASKDGTLSIWTDQFELKNQLTVSPQGLRCIAFQIEKKWMAVGSSDHRIYLYDAFHSEKKILEEPGNSVFSLASSSDGNYLLAGGRDALLYVYNTPDFSLVKKINAHWFTINHILFLEGTNFFATASRDKTIRLWSTSDFSPVKSLDVSTDGHKNSVNRLLWLKESSLLISTGDDKSILVWHLRTE